MGVLQQLNRLVGQHPVRGPIRTPDLGGSTGGGDDEDFEVGGAIWVSCANLVHMMFWTEICSGAVGTPVVVTRCRDAIEELSGL